MQKPHDETNPEASDNMPKPEQAAEVRRCTSEQIATIDAHNAWLSAALARCTTLEQRMAVDERARAAQAHRIVPILPLPQCAKCGWCMTWVKIREGLECWAWDYSSEVLIRPIDASAAELCPTCDPEH